MDQPDDRTPERAKRAGRTRHRLTPTTCGRIGSTPTMFGFSLSGAAVLPVPSTRSHRRRGARRLVGEPASPTNRHQPAMQRAVAGPQRLRTGFRCDRSVPRTSLTTETQDRIPPGWRVRRSASCLRPAHVPQATEGGLQVPGGQPRGQRVRIVEPGLDQGHRPQEGVQRRHLTAQDRPGCLRSDLVRRGFVPISRSRRRIARGRRASSVRDRVQRPCQRRRCRATRSRNCRCGRESGWQ